MNNPLSRTLPLKLIWENFVTAETESRRIILHKRRKESNLHVILKVLAYCYFWEKKLIIEPRYTLNRYRPDLIAWGRSEIPTKEEWIPSMWIECKHVKIKKLIKLSRAFPFSNIVWFHLMRPLAKVLEGIQSKQYLFSNVQLIGIKTLDKNWDSLKESINLKQPQWGIIKHKNNLMVINRRERERDPVNLEFYILPATIKTQI
ncbi:MAG: hypothetical protein ACFFB2_02915 [Promethearchaeota archaeon]